MSPRTPTATSDLLAQEEQARRRRRAQEAQPHEQQAESHSRALNGASEPPPDPAEQALLGALLQGEALAKVRHLIHPEDYQPRHRLILAAAEILERDGKPIDPITVSEQLERMAHLAAAGGRLYLIQLVSTTPKTTPAAVYAGVVRERALRRGVQGLLDDPKVDSAHLLAGLDSYLLELRAIIGGASPVQALALESAATWAEHAAPAARDWVIEGLIPAARVTSLLGNGGLGKTIIASQLAVHVATGRPLFGLEVNGGPVVGIFCEDERDELERRIRAAAAGEQLDLAQLERLYPVSRDGMDNLLCTFDHEQIVLTAFHQQLEAAVSEMRPRLVILDTAADLFAGDYVSTPHVRQFIKVALGRLCTRYGTAVLLIAHPSASGLASGDGGGFSVAWNNSVRSRLYLRRPKSDDLEAVKDRRVLEVRKSNYAAHGVSIPLVFQDGYFVQDPEPLNEAKAVRAPRADTRLAMACLAYMREKGGGGAVVAFGAIYESLQAVGELPRGTYETVRKPLQRTLDQLMSEGIITQSKVPRGYRLALEGTQ